MFYGAVGLSSGQGSAMPGSRGVPQITASKIYPGNHLGGGVVETDLYSQ